MKLYDEEELRSQKEKDRKVRRYVLIGIFTSIIAIVALMGIIFYLIYNPNKITIFVDGKESTKLEEMFIYKTADDGSTIIYAPIRATAEWFGYKTNDGEYTTNLEDKDSCYVEIKDEKGATQEIAIFSLDATTIYKIDLSNKNNTSEYEYEEIKTENPIIKESDTLYVDAYGLKKALNMTLSYNEKTKRITIRTLSSLVASAEKIIADKTASDDKYGKLDEKYINQKALLDNMMVIVSKTDAKKGVRNFETASELLGSQYTDITYIPQKGSFLVKDNNNKVGIIGKDVSIKTQYDSLTLIDAEHELYLAENNGLYGVIDKNENTKIYLEYNKIGVDVSQYASNGLKNGYVLLGKIIPVQKEDKWIFYSIETTKNQDGTINVQCVPVQNVECDNVGCITNATGATANNLMVIPEYNLIVVQKQGYYGVMDFTGALPIPAVLKDLYIATISGKTDYYMVYLKDGKEHTYNIIEQLQKRGYTKK